MNREIMDFVQARGITEVVHFTTNHGLLGVFASQAVLSRDQLNADQYLENIRKVNCASRKDPEWTDYVNMSISVANKRMLTTSQGWHGVEDVWWAVLSFSAEVLADEGVWFTTTNNTYATTVRRGQGLAGLQDLYSEPIPWGYYGAESWRRGLPDHRPTNDQAEVLYPRSVPIGKLRAIYVPKEEHLEDIEGWVAAIPSVPHVPVMCRPEVFLNG
ncbi:DarT ssDNA thymidine ADP-ribosyltransferase family protein [Nocardia kruczakiae]|uniref:DarT ssDNA thymidine ADP-ribosyltransferase family protein n=1 Tax=Nocardia kruczakiae TaxID=261477 RepID=UPI000A064C3E|nr:DarT ssDNA thymidine ADP-ribosyltransferase family protein [Nocardia kruczakiae]